VRWRLVAERARMTLNHEDWLPRVVAAVKEAWPDAEVYLVGSVARGEATGASDVDILVVTANPPTTPAERARAKTEIEERAGLPDHNPLDIHYAKPHEKEETLKRARAYKRLA